MRERQRGGRRGGSRRTEGAVHARPLPRPRVGGLPGLGGHDGGSCGEGEGQLQPWGGVQRGEGHGKVRGRGGGRGLAASHRMRGARNGC